MLSSTRRELEDIFLGLGFTVMEGPEIETVHYNFDALNHSPTHPARAHTDTFYVAGAPREESEELLLRTHTSPMQVRAMEAHPPPLYVVIPGRVYRPDSDATHTPQFHQIEGLEHRERSPPSASCARTPSVLSSPARTAEIAPFTDMSRDKTKRAAPALTQNASELRLGRTSMSKMLVPPISQIRTVAMSEVGPRME